MSEPTPSSPPGGRATARDSAQTGRKLLACLGWLALLCGIAVFAVASFLRSEHRAESERRHALAGEQRSVAAAAATLASNLAGGSVPAVSAVSTLRLRSLAVLARVPPGPEVHLRLQTEWTHLASGVDALQAEWTRILEFRSGLEALREAGRALRAGSDRLADVLSTGSRGPAEWAETLALVSRRFTEELDRASLAHPARLDRARELLDVQVRVRGFLAAGIARQPAATASRAGGVPAPYKPYDELATLDARLDAARDRLDAVRSMAGTLESVPAEIRNLAEGSARVMALLPEFEARAGQGPALFGASLDTWLLRSAILAVAGLLALFWWRQRLIRAEAAGLDRAWGEAAESDWRARDLLRDLLRAIDTLDRRPAKEALFDGEDLEGSVREAKASLPRIVARRSQLAAALLSAREALEGRLSAARESVLAQVDPGSGELDTSALLELEATFREATLFAMAALAREIRAAASADATAGEAAGAPPPPARATNGTEAIHDIVARGFDLLERSLQRVLAGEKEERTALIFVLDDLRAVRGKTPFSSSLDFDPDLAPPPETGRSETGVNDPTALRSDADRMLPSFRKGLAEWTAGDGDGVSAAKLVRGSVSVLARAAEEGRSPARTFWNVAAAFCTALCERAIPAGPAARRIMGEVAGQFEATAEREDAPLPPDRLLRELLLYIALAESDHEELQEVRAAFGLERYPLAIPERPVETDAADGEPGADISMEIIQQLEGIRAALDRINGPSESSSQPPPQP